MYCNENLSVWSQEIQSDEIAAICSYEDWAEDWAKEITEDFED